MKDELIDTINKKTWHNESFMLASAFSLAGINVLLMLMITHIKHPEVFNMVDVTLIKSLFRNFSS